MTIAGSLPVVDPSTGEPFTEVPAASLAQLDEAVAAANAGFSNSGQVCAAFEAVAAEAATVVVLPGTQEGVTAGPAVADRLDAGSVWVNQHPVVTAGVPFGGTKQSGIGVEGSLHDLHAYTDIRVSTTKR